jgi:hypothetical protein
MLINYTLPFGPKVLFLIEGNHAEGVMGGVAFKSIIEYRIRLKITLDNFTIFFLFAYGFVRKNILTTTHNHLCFGD